MKVFTGYYPTVTFGTTSQTLSPKVFYLQKEKIMDEFIYDEDENNVVEEPHSIWSMARIGNFKCKAYFSVNIYSGEGPIPHFHIKNIQTNEEACVRIDCAEYFPHSDKTMVLNSGQRKALVDFLNERPSLPEYLGLSNYELIWMQWNINNPSYRIPKPDSMPDYNNL